MGLLSWLFPSPTDRIARARRLIDRRRWADARMEVLDLDEPDARAILDEAERHLAEENLEAAISWSRAGDDRRVENHLELAESFRKPGMDETFRAARRAIREAFRQRSATARRDEEERQARTLSVDPFGLGGSTSLLDAPPDPDVSPDDEEKAARIALLVENTPEALRPRIAALGPSFTDAVLALDDGRPDVALEGLLALPDDDPLVIWERARCAYALGDAAAAARALSRFPDAAGGHLQMGRLHSAVFLAQLLTEVGRADEAVRVLRDARAVDPEVGTGLFARLLEETGDVEEAEAVLVAAIRRHGKALPYYAHLARLRLKGGHRAEAMAILERAMDQCHCGTGQCGKVPPDPDVVRTLATLYLEDGTDVPRGLDLADQAAALARRPTWDDAYLAALAAHHRDEPVPDGLLRQLHATVADGDPRKARLVAHLPPPA